MGTGLVEQNQEFRGVRFLARRTRSVDECQFPVGNLGRQSLRPALKPAARLGRGRMVIFTPIRPNTHTGQRTL